jgi:class 3 adenylate cyclase/tetratricopeptide (TPR) repeat protein
MRFCGHCGTPLQAPSPEEAPKQDTVEARVNAALKSFVSEQVAERITEEGGRPAEERRLVTALFADLSGFTPLADKLDPEELLEVIDPVINRLTDVVGRYEGYVDKFAGDALLAFFGAPVAHEDDAERALLVALDMHRELAALVPELPEDAHGLTLHTGVNTGHVIARVLGTEVRMDYSVLGDAVILAQRLESAAPAGSTYVGELTHTLTQESFEFTSVGELTLKGKAEPVSAWRLIGPRAARVRFTTPRFVGRSKELETARLVLDRAADGSGAVVTVSGEPGVGKTRLTSEIERQARTRGFMWLTGRCLSYGSAVAYWPFADLFRSFFGIGPDEPHGSALPRMQAMLAELSVEEALPYLARLLGLPASELQLLDPETYRRRLHENVLAVLRAIAERTPIVLAVEDLHWGDASSIALVTDLAGLASSQPLVIYLTARSEAIPVLVEIASGTPDLMRHVFRLERFTQIEIEELVSELLEGGVPPEIVQMISDRSAGNPFFAEEILRVMKDSGQITLTPTGWRAQRLDEASLPPTVEGVLSSRIDLLPRSTATVLQKASVIGRRVRIPILRKLEPAAANLDRELDILIERGYLDAQGSREEVVFHHALVQEVAYSRLLRKQKRELHRNVASVAEELYGSDEDVIDLLARHLYLGQAGSKAIDYLIRAGDRSKRLFANEEAILHYSHAAELARADDGSERSHLNDILLQLGDLHEIRGQYEAASTLYEEVRSAGVEVQAWRGLASSLRNQSRYEEVHKLIEEAFTTQDFSDEERAALWLEKGWTLVREGKFEESEQSFRDALAALDGKKDLLAAELMLQLAGTETALGQLEQGLADAIAAVEIFEQEGSLRGQTSAMRILGDAFRELGRYEEAAAALTRGIGLAEQTGSVEEIGGCLINLALVEMKRDNVDEAIECNRRAAERFEEIGHPVGRAISYANLAEFLATKGDMDEAYEVATKARDIGLEIEAPFVVADAQRALALVHIDRGEHIKAADLAEKAAELQLEIGFAAEAAASLELASAASEEAGQKERALELRSRALSITESSSGTP